MEWEMLKKGFRMQSRGKLWKMWKFSRRCGKIKNWIRTLVKFSNLKPKKIWYKELNLGKMKKMSKIMTKLTSIMNKVGKISKKLYLLSTMNPSNRLTFTY